ncbi:hypothetical protein [Kibdelosporangium phytohabitans]|uniref:Uncharacterized protein n=1 Tax=Kibdelosporangium phytohabitans TaxID=860235 RepID=A0A0N9I8Z4_9PSEU|nr:hypothetical protein [Kibdelosporangium phytohabitans]ALG12837.1 hypothetical protein AOZ06_43630 [Kibdelosporangium phytohabitans]MBE1464529.1 hypothetical protein [Kibdelosporangium phytohabitans]
MTYPGPGWQPSPYGGYAPRQNTAPAYIAAALFAVCAVLSLVISILSIDKGARTIEMYIAVPGMMFSEDITGNGDFGYSTGISVGCTFALLAVLLAVRLSFARWLIAVLGGLVAMYYMYAVIKVLVDGGGEFIAALALALVLWVLATVLVLLPPVGQAMRGRRF